MLTVPSNRAAPIAATLRFLYEGSASVDAEFDFLHAGEPCWNIEIATDGGTRVVVARGQRLAVDGKQLHAGEDREYDGALRAIRGADRRARFGRRCEAAAARRRCIPDRAVAGCAFLRVLTGHPLSTDRHSKAFVLGDWGTSRLRLSLSRGRRSRRDSCRSWHRRGFRRAPASAHRLRGCLAAISRRAGCLSRRHGGFTQRHP